MWKDGLIRDLLCIFVESMLHCHIWIIYVCQHFFFFFCFCFFFSSKKTSINKRFLFCLSTAINIIIFKQSNQHHHFSSTAINIIIFQAKQSTSSFSSKAINIIIFKQSSQHHHCSSKASSVIIFQATSSFFGQYNYNYLLAFYLLQALIFGLGSIIILFKQTVLRQAPEMYDILNMPCESRG